MLLWSPEDLTPQPILRFEHPQCVLSLAWSPLTANQATSLASGCTAGLVHLWQPAQAKEQATQPYLIYRGHVRFVRSLSWSPDRRYIASGGDYGDNTVQVWEAETGHLRFTHTTQYRIFAAPFSPLLPMAKFSQIPFVANLHPMEIPPLIASGSFDGSVQVWSALNGERIQEYLGHQGPVYTLSWSPDGTRLVSAGQDARAIVWSAKHGGELLIYTGHKQPIKTTAWSPNGSYIATGGDDGTVQIWSVSDGQVRSVYHHPSWVRALAWSPDGTSVVCTSGKSIHIWS